MNLIEQITIIAPEIILAIGIIVILIADLILNKKNHGARAIIAFTVYLISFYALVMTAESAPGYAFQGQIHADKTAFFIRLLLVFIGMIAVIISYTSPELEDFLPGEYQMLLMGSILGGMFMTMAANMVMIYLSLEFVSILSYILTAVRIRNSKAFEGAIKYILFGALSSGILLFGLSYLFGISGSLDITVLGNQLKNLTEAGGASGLTNPAAFGSAEKFLLWLAFAFVIGGLFYKIAVVPFHAWCPDVYEGAPTPVTMFFSIGPKIAGFALLMRFFSEIFPWQSFSLYKNLFFVLGLVSAITMTLGNFAALRQKNIKRLLAYSSIAHAGYLLAGFSAYSEFSNQAVLFYLLAYLIMNSGAFLVAIAVGTLDETRGEMNLDSFSGLAFRGSRGAFWATIMTIFLFSLIGIPPFVGFIGKYYIFAALLKKEIYWLAIIGIINTVVSLYYYALILKYMFFDQPKEEFVPEGSNDGIFATPLYTMLGLVLVILTVLFGIFPSLVTLP